MALTVGSVIDMSESKPVATPQELLQTLFKDEDNPYIATLDTEHDACAVTAVRAYAAMCPNWNLQQAIFNMLGGRFGVTVIHLNHEVEYHECTAFADYDEHEIALYLSDGSCLKFMKVNVEGWHVKRIPDEWPIVEEENG